MLKRFGRTGAEVETAQAAIARLLDRAVFVAGRGRSGSSLLLRLFDGHPQVFSVPRESRVLTEIAPALRAGGGLEATRASLVDRFADFADEAVRTDAEARIDAGLAGLDPASAALPRDLLRIGLEALACGRDPSEARCLLEKTPKNEAHFDEMFAALPSAKVIYLVRDPRAVYLSNARSEAFRMEPDFAARQWVKSLRAVLRQVVKFGKAERILVVRYEDLVSRPAPTLAEICGFIGVDVDPALERPTVDGAPWTGNTYGAGAVATDGIDAAKAERWRAEIGPDDHAAIVAVARFEMSLLGYPLS